MATKKKPRNERTSTKVASLAGKALKGPTRKGSFVEWMALCARTKGPLTTTGAFYAGARWWHRRVKSALGSALTQASGKKGE